MADVFNDAEGARYADCLRLMAGASIGENN